MSLIAIIDSDKFMLNGRRICEAEPVEAFHQLLGGPTRIEAAGPPAPIGHRNNQIHYYDNLGLYLNEHHSTCLIEAVTFVLWRAEAIFVTDSEMIGELRVGGILVKSGMTEYDMQAAAIPFESQLRGSWHFKSKDLWIGFETKGKQGPSGRRSKKRQIVSLSVCLKHDPWADRSCHPKGL